MRPSGLHVNKPVIFGLILTVVLIFLAYRYLTRSVIVTAVGVETEKLEAIPELSGEVQNMLKRESKQIDVKVEDATVKIHVEQVVKVDNPKLDVLFLHGASFSSKHWQDIKSTDHVANWGYRAVAIDLPGKDKSPDTLSESLVGKFLDAFIKALEMNNIVIIAPSASGKYALPYLFNESNSSRDRVVGFVPVAPVETSTFKAKFPESQVQTLIVYGSKDKARADVFLNNLKLIPHHKVVKIEDAGHACYLDKPEAFHQALFHFLKGLEQ